MRLDFAYNLVSALVLLGFLMLLYTIGKKVTGRAWAGVLAVIFFYFQKRADIFPFFYGKILKTGLFLKLWQKILLLLGTQKMKIGDFGILMFI